MHREEIQRAIARPDRQEYIRERFLKIYFRDVPSLTSLSKQIGVDKSVFKGIIRKTAQYNHIASLIKIMQWVLENED